MADPLSGDIEGMAPSHPDNPAEPTSPIPAPAAPQRAPAAIAQPPAPAQPAPQKQTMSFPDLEVTPAAKNPSQGDAPGNPFAPGAQADTAPPQPTTDAPGNPFAPPPPVQPDTSAMQNYVKTNLAAQPKAEASAEAPQATPVPISPQDAGHDFVHGLEAGLQMSVSGLGIRGKMPDTILPQDADMAMRIGSQIGGLTGDLPAMVAGMISGTAAGGAAGTAALPVVGTVSGGVVGGMAGAFAVPAAVRKMLIDHYERGDIKDPTEFASRLMATSWEAIKGATTGAATALTGGAVSPVAGKMAGMASELLAMTTVGKALEGHLPTMQDFEDGAIVIGGLHAAGHFIPGVSGDTSNSKLDTEAKLKNIFAATGETPAQIIEQAQSDIELKQNLVAGNVKDQPQAAPTKLIPSSELINTRGGAEQFHGTSNEIQPATEKDLGITPEIKPVGEKLSYSDAEQEILSKIGVKAAPETEGGVVQKVQDIYANAKEKVSDAWDDFYAKNIDYLDPINAAIEEAKRRGSVVTENAYDLGRILAAHMDKVRSFLEFGTRDGATGAINGEGLNDIFRDIPDQDFNGYRAYAMAQRALELDSQGRTPWADFNREGAELVVKNGAERFEDINQRRIDFGNRVIDYAVDKGRLSEESAAAMKRANQNYLPFSRVFDENEVTGEKPKAASVYKKMAGDEANIVDPILQTYKNTEAVIKNVLVNEVRSTFLKNLEGTDLIGTGKEGEDLSNAILNPVSQPGIIRDRQIAVYEDGVRKVYEGSPLVIDSLKRLDGDNTAMELTAQVLRKFSNTLRFGVVNANPAFGFAHFFRSQIMSGIYSETGMIPFIHPALSLGDFFSKSDMYQDWLYNGGASGSLLKLQDTYLKDNKVLEADTKAPFLNRAWNAVKLPFEATEGFIKLTDNLSRFTEYKRAIEQGKNPLEAAMLSRDVVPDYAKVGLQRSVVRTGVAFIGAHINSLDRMGQAFTEDPMGTALKMSVLTAMSAALWVVNKDDPAIDALPDWQKNSYWNINISRFSPSYKSGEDATILRLPKPWAPGILFGSGAEVALDAYAKYRPQEINHFSTSIAKSVLPDLMPNMLQPIMDQYSNKQSFSGRPLVPEYKQKLLPEMQYAPYTSETAKAIAKVIGYVPLVKDLGPSTDTLASPAVVENYIKSWSGTAGGYALQLSDWAGRGFTPSIKAEPWENTPYLHQFVSRYPSFQDQRLQDFYENKDEADKAYNSAKVAAEAGNFDQALAIQKAHPDFQVRLNGIASAISTARKTHENIQDDPNIPNVEKRQNLDTILFQIGSMAKEGNQMMSDFHANLRQNNQGSAK